MGGAGYARHNYKMAAAASRQTHRFGRRATPRATGVASVVVKAYESIGTFTGILIDSREISYSEYYSTTRKRIKITDTRESVLSTLRRIYSYRHRESIWTGLTEEGGSYVLYIQPSDIIGPCHIWEECTYRIKEVTSVNHLNWQRRKYDALINVTLEVTGYTYLRVRP